MSPNLTARARGRLASTHAASRLAVVGLCGSILAAPCRAQAPAGWSPAALAYCSARLPAPASDACPVALRYLRAEMTGTIWPAGDSAASLGLSRDQYAWTYAIVGIDPEVCGARVAEDTAVVLVQIGELGFVASGNETGYWTLAPLSRPDGHGGVVFLDPPVRWSVREYRVLRVAGRWIPYYPPGIENGPEPLIGVAAAVRHYEGPHAGEFRQQLEEARASLRRLPRPSCQAAEAGAQASK